MELTLEKLLEITNGCVAIKKSDDGYFGFFRMSENESAVYAPIPEYFYKSLSASSIFMECVTDAEALSFDYHVNRTTSRIFYYFDIYIDDVLYKSIGKEDGGDEDTGNIKVKLPAGEKKLAVYFPNLHKTELKNILFENSSKITPVKRKCKILCYGDSISQGFIAKHPSLAYINRVSSALGAEVFNKSVGGATFDPDLLACSVEENPEYVIIAYGTNDWNSISKEEFKPLCAKFLQNASKQYPASKIFVLTPIWRSDWRRETKFGSFWYVGEYIKEICSDLSNVTVVDGAYLVPHSSGFMADLVVHPNDEGHILMAEQLLKNML